MIKERFEMALCGIGIVPTAAVIYKISQVGFHYPAGIGLILACALVWLGIGLGINMSRR